MGIQLTSTERALELEMYQIVDETGIATKAPRGPTSKLPDDKVDRVRQNSKDCRNAVEVLLLYTCLFEWPATPGASSPSEAMSFRRKMQYKALTTRITWVMRKALHLHGRLIEDIPEFDASSPWGKWLKEMGDGESIFSAPVHQKIFGIMQGLKYDADDKVMFMRHPTSKAINEERVKELMIPVPLLDRKADPRVDDIPTWDTSAYQEALQSTVAHGRRLAIEMESRFREIRFMKALRNCQAWVANPNAPAAVRTCSKCRIPCTDPRNTRVVGPCGHMFCRDCFNDIPETRGLCTMENCDAVMVPNSQYTAQLLGTDDGDPVKQAHGAKVGEIVKLVHNTLAGEQVLLFVQFDKIMKPISKALEDQGISNYALHDGNKATHAKKMLAFQNEKMPTAKKVLILNATKDVAAGA